MATIAILGGGISGLSSAFYLSKFAPFAASIKRIVLLEASNRCGGWIKSTKLENGAIMEHGPRTIRGSGPAAYNTFDLLEDLELDLQMLPISSTHPGLQQRYIVYDEQFHSLPKDIWGTLPIYSPFSRPFASYAFTEPFKRRQVKDDESVHDFISRRFSGELADLLIDPMCRGIFAGDCRDLSVKSCFNMLYEYEKNYGSVLLGMLRSPKSPPPTGKIAKTFKANKWSVWSMEKGLEQLIHGLCDYLKSEDRLQIYTNKPCTKVEFGESSTKVYSNEECFEVDHVVSSCLSSALASSLPTEHGVLRKHLNAIPAVTTGVVNLEYAGSVGYRGFGYLIPSIEPIKMLGCIFDSELFAEHEARGDPTTRFTVMMGGAWFDRDFGDPDNVNKDDLAEIAQDLLVKHMGLPDKTPLTSIVNIHKNCIPQYIVGHSKNLEDMEKYISEHNLALTLTGSSYRGVAVNDVIFDARKQVEKLLTKLEK